MKTNHWNIDTTHSSIGFAVKHMVFSKVRGRFADWTGKIELDPVDPTSGRVSVRIDTASIDTGVADRDNHLRSGDFFDAEQFPAITFESTSVVKDGGKLRVTGDLTIRDVTKPVVLEVESNGRAKDPWGNDRVAFEAKTSIDRRDFGLTWNQVLEAGGVLVGERIDIAIEVQAVAAAAGDEQAA